MNCAEFRRCVGAQPSLDSEALRAHTGSCEACARYREELQQMDRLIHRALKVDVDFKSSGSAGRRTSSQRHTGYWAKAAGFLLALSLATFLWMAAPRGSLAEQLVQHTKKEANALVKTSDRVDAAELAAILRRADVQLPPHAIKVSYAMSCWFRGHYVPHLVVQTQRGPVTVLVLRHEQPPEQALQFSEDGYTGVIVPAQHGALAVLARGAPVKEAAVEVLRVLEYEE